jgi:hypothetical protein
MKAGLVCQTREQSPIRLLTLSLTTKEDTPPYWNRGGAPFHPSCGTAPYTPPRYFW